MIRKTGLFVFLMAGIFNPLKASIIDEIDRSILTENTKLENEENNIIYLNQIIEVKKDQWRHESNIQNGYYKSKIKLMQKYIVPVFIFTKNSDLLEEKMAIEDLNDKKRGGTTEYLNNCKNGGAPARSAPHFVGNIKEGLCINPVATNDGGYVTLTYCDLVAVCVPEVSQIVELDELANKKNETIYYLYKEFEIQRERLKNSEMSVKLYEFNINYLKNLKNKSESLTYFLSIKNIIKSQMNQFVILENFFKNNDRNGAINILNAMNSSYEKVLMSQTNTKVRSQILIAKNTNELLINNLKNDANDINYYVENLNKFKTNYTLLLKMTSEEFSNQYLAAVENAKSLKDDNLKNQYLDELDKIKNAFEAE